MQPLTVSLVQSATHWHDAEKNRTHFADVLAALPNSDLVVLPEMFTTGFTMASTEVAEPMNGPTLDWLAQQAVKLDATITGSVVIEDQGHYYNRLIVMQPDGDFQHYDKRHLFRMADEHDHYSAGGGKIIFSLREWRICPMVCYDLRFPVWFRNQSEYDVLLCVANWPAARREAWNTLLRARAIENQCYSVGVNIVGEDGAGVRYSGGSAVYGPEGNVLGELFDTAQTFTVELDGGALGDLRERFPVWRDADEFQIQT